MEIPWPDEQAVEKSHERDWRHFPTCAQPCLLNKTDGYWHERCDRDDGGCCPGAKAEGVKHFDIWDCIQQKCEADHVQEAADLFLSECASKGHALPVNFTLGIPSWFERDHFPAQFVYKDFVTPIEGVSISGFYGWGALLAWNVALIAAAFSGLRRFPGRKRHTRSDLSHLRRVFQVVRRFFWYIRQDGELLAALAVPCMAAADIHQQQQRVSFQQLFTYDHPSFVPEIYGEDSAEDILTIRAAVVVVNHFLISAFALASVSWFVDDARQLEHDLEDNSPGPLYRVVFRTMSILVASLWCFLAARPIYCADSFRPLDDWYGGCRITNHFLTAASCATFQGVSCDVSVLRVPALTLTGVMLIIPAVIMLLGFEKWPPTRRDWEGLATVLAASSALLLFILANLYLGFSFTLNLVFSPFVNLPIFMFWYFLPNGRECTFRASNMIGFMEMDQIFTLAVAAALGLASIWDSIGSFVGEMSQLPV